MEDTTVAVEGYVRYRKVRSTHRMYCPVRERKVVLGPTGEDGDIAYLTPAGTPPGNNESWERIDGEQHEAEAVEQELTEKAGDPEGTLVIQEVTDGGYDVINTATKESVNTEPLTKEQAEAIVSGSPEEKKGILASIKEKFAGKKDDAPPLAGTCPSTHKFGKDHDEHDECDDCPLAVSCGDAKQAAEDKG